MPKLSQVADISACCERNREAMPIAEKSIPIIIRIDKFFMWFEAVEAAESNNLTAQVTAFAAKAVSAVNQVIALQK